MIAEEAQEKQPDILTLVVAHNQSTKLPLQSYADMRCGVTRHEEAH